MLTMEKFHIIFIHLVGLNATVYSGVIVKRHDMIRFIDWTFTHKPIWIDFVLSHLTTTNSKYTFEETAFSVTWTEEAQTE